MTDNIERRKHPRFNVRWPIRIITDQGMAEGESRNITVAGMFVHCDEPLRKDKVYQLIVEVPKQNPLLVRGRVMWSNLGNLDPRSTFPGMGLFFIQLAKDDREFLRDMIQALSKK